METGRFSIEIRNKFSIIILNDIVINMFKKIKRQCVYKALYYKLTEQSLNIADRWTNARLHGEQCHHFMIENVRIHRMIEKTKSKMWWVTKKTL